MNGARTTNMRKGHLLTALAAAVLLAASPGTALAQTVSFSQTTGTVVEGVAAGSTNPRPFSVTVSRSAAPAQGTDIVGTVTFVTTPVDAGAAGFTISAVPALTSTNQINFDINNQAVLTIVQDADANWNPEMLTVALQAGAGTSIGAPLRVSAKDAQGQPSVSFSAPSVELTENSRTDVDVSVGVARGEMAPDLTGFTDTADDLIRIKVEPADALDEDGVAGNDDSGPIVLMVGTTTIGMANAVAMMPGVYDLPITIANAAATATTARRMTVTATPDMSGFTDPMITISAMDLNKGTDGTISGGAMVSIRVLSDEPAPTLSFSPTDVTINEGESVETVLIAEGAHGSEVGMVKLSVEGDAMVSLMHGGEMLEEMDGHVYVDLGDSNSARLTAMSHSDPDLMDGDTAYKAWKLVEGATDGANIGDGYWFRVDVTGSTAVPALPLVGQLLLALFLMAGGSRLYRRRQG